MDALEATIGALPFELRAPLASVTCVLKFLAAESSRAPRLAAIWGRFARRRRGSNMSAEAPNECVRVSRFEIN